MSNLPYKGRKFTHCADCSRVLVTQRLGHGQPVATLSNYPYCARCLFARAEDTEFKEWLGQKLSARRA